MPDVKNILSRNVLFVRSFNPHYVSVTYSFAMQKYIKQELKTEIRWRSHKTQS